MPAANSFTNYNTFDYDSAFFIDNVIYSNSEVVVQQQQIVVVVMEEVQIEVVVEVEEEVVDEVEVGIIIIIIIVDKVELSYFFGYRYCLSLIFII